jgi:predicted anti-sigma-YlaC factor YlaD
MILEPDSHLAEDDLERYSMGELAGEECARLEEHLLLCETCRQRVREQDLFVRSMKHAAEEWRKQEKRRTKKGHAPLKRDMAG